MKKVILAYSGGLDTSCCIKWLKDKGYEVIAFIADLGQGGDFKSLKAKALKTGASKVYVKDLKDEFIQDYVFPVIKANAIYENKYLLATALSRPLIAKHLVDIAHKEKAGFIAHGSTGKGNDQVRFEVSSAILDSKIKTIAPLRVWELRSREEEIEYALKNKIPIDVTKKKPYSIDKNLWGVSIEAGVLEDLAKEPPKDVFKTTKEIPDTPTRAAYLDIGFEKGIPCKINSKTYSGLNLILKLNKIGANFGIGRTDLVENRLVGIKSREIYEAPGAWILYLAHRELESLVLDREVMHFKEMISLKYAELAYYGLWFTPLKSALDKFIDETQKNVTGKIRVKLTQGHCIPVARSSKFSLYKKALATYSAQDKFDQKLSEGFVKIWGLPYTKMDL